MGALMKSEELAEVIPAELDGVAVELTHEERVEKIRALEQAGRTDVLKALDVLLVPYLPDADISN